MNDDLTLGGNEEAPSPGSFYRDRPFWTDVRSLGRKRPRLSISLGIRNENHESLTLEIDGSFPYVHLSSYPEKWESAPVASVTDSATENALRKHLNDQVEDDSLDLLYLADPEEKSDPSCSCSCSCGCASCVSCSSCTC
jgi:hypothetical protein